MGFALVSKRSFIGNRIVEEGEVIPYTGKFGSNIQPCDAEGKLLTRKAKEGDPKPGETLA